MKKIINETQIAILLGVYNGELYIREQIESILSQSFQNWTLYIRDDASTDNTISILNEYALKRNKVVLITDNDGNLGCNGNYYQLLSMVESEYYMFCNADDYWYPFKIELSFERMLYEEIKHKDKPIVVHTDLSIADKNLNILTESYWISVNTNPEKYKTYNKLGVCSVVGGATMLFNHPVKNLTLPVLDYEHALFFDNWIALKVVNKGIIATIHTPTIAYRQIGTNLSAVSIGYENSLFFKVKKIKKVIAQNIKEARLLNKAGWGSYLKYIYYKIIVLSISRLGYKYEKEREKYQKL